MERKINRFTICLTLFFAIHLAGIIGLSLESTRPLFLKLVVFHLLMSASLLFAFHKNWNLRFLILSTLIFLTGYFVEVAGVSTGIIFGSYQYGEVLGFKLFNVPLLIGLNWFLLVYAAGSFVNQFTLSVPLKILLAAVSLVVLDYFIEPAAIRFSFWSWNGDIPFRNYLAWFIVSIILLTLLYSFPYFSQNRLGKYFYPVQFLFFVSLYLLS